jgi:RpiR family carbohydrate utilization transcriptional regulator
MTSQHRSPIGDRAPQPRRASTAPRRPRAPLLERIAESTVILRRSEQRVAAFVLRQPNRVIELGLSAVAAGAGVSHPTVARFCQAMGFTGFRAFKMQLAKSLAGGIPFVHRDVGANDSAAEIGAKVFDRAIAALIAVRNHLDPAAMAAAIKCLAAARRIEFYGQGNSGIVALDAQHKFFRLGAATAAYADAHVHAMAASLLDRGDAVVAISGSGRTRDLIRSVEIARDAGATVIAITVAGSPLARVADIGVFADVPEDPDVYAPMTSRLAHLAMLDVLAVGVAVARGPDLIARLKRAKDVISEKRFDGH